MQKGNGKMKNKKIFNSFFIFNTIIWIIGFVLSIGFIGFSIFLRVTNGHFPRSASGGVNVLFILFAILFVFIFFAAPIMIIRTPYRYTFTEKNVTLHRLFRLDEVIEWEKVDEVYLNFGNVYPKGGILLSTIELFDMFEIEYKPDGKRSLLKRMIMSGEVTRDDKTIPLIKKYCKNKIKNEYE